MRFAETNSFERDGLKPNAWKYRDYVIRSFNDDKPYDQFVREQLAGDELDQVTDETMIATGYYRLGIWDDEPADPLQARYDEFDDIISTTSQALLGLTVGCARCHDHKIDPIPQADYYGLLAFFADVTPYGDISERHGDALQPVGYVEARRARPPSALRDKADAIRKEMRAMEEVGIQRMSAGDQEIARTPDRARLLKDKARAAPQRIGVGAVSGNEQTALSHAARAQKLPPLEAALALAKCEPHPATRRTLCCAAIHTRRAMSSSPTSLPCSATLRQHIPPAAESARSAGRRRVLADWIASPRNMLTARVIVNRVWQHYFGRGLVRSANNFGELGTPPTHPELLDFLALWLVDHNWQAEAAPPADSHVERLSHVVRRQRAGARHRSDERPALAVRHAAARRRRNPRRHARRLRRIQPDHVRPRILSRTVAGSFGHAIAARRRLGRIDAEEQARRSIYIHIKRSLLPPLLTAFDFPDVDSSCEARFVTTQPGQALAMLHGDFLNEQAGKLAARVTTEAGTDARAQVAHAIRLALDRPATDEEIADGLDLINRLTKDRGQKPADALRYWCLTVLNLNEFVYLD